MDLARLIEGLSRPAAYPEPPGEVVVRQTHISVVFLAGRHVYKIKKPVDLGFLDFRTLEARRHFCAEEVGGRSIAAALHAAQRWLREDIRSGLELRDRVLPELLAGLDDDHLKRACRQRAAYYAEQFGGCPPFAAPVHWAPFIATGLSYPLPPEAVTNGP
jgi:hypothetical protein